MNSQKRSGDWRISWLNTSNKPGDRVVTGSGSIAANLAAVRRQIQQIALRAGREPADIELIAVSKTRTLAEVLQVVSSGQLAFGENTIQDAMSKIPGVKNPDVRWHFIGHLQSKKAPRIPGNFHWLHSLDSLKLARKLSSAMLDSGLADRLECLLQVNVAGETTKSGLQPAAVRPFLDELLKLELPALNWRGLMTIGVQGDEDETRRAFGRLRKLQQRCRDEFSLPAFDQLSMGMSDDYEIAIEEGSTMVRVGTAIFGQRSG
jgi:pyridoxal phosphate enzyme (YggS family)